MGNRFKQLARLARQLGIAPPRRFDIKPHHVQGQPVLQKEYQTFLSRQRTRFRRKGRPAPGRRGSYGHEPSPVCSTHHVHMRHVGREFSQVHGRAVQTWRCPVPCCGQGIAKPYLP